MIEIVYLEPAFPVLHKLPITKKYGRSMYRIVVR